MTKDKEEHLKQLCEALKTLTDGQVGWVEHVVAQFGREHDFNHWDQSDIITPCVLQDFGDALRIHHCFSREPFSKDKFEYALERVINLCGMQAELAPKGNPGHDITINGQRFSLKTQADKNLRENKLHISKFMELGKGDWSNKDDELIGLRQQFLYHMRSYDRILSLRKLSKDGQEWRYELVEIPRELLLEAEHGELEMKHDSTQLTKPGYCHVADNQGKYKFQLYFDGGGERKLQIKNLQKQYCIVHAQWSFFAG